MFVPRKSQVLRNVFVVKYCKFDFEKKNHLDHFYSKLLNGKSSKVPRILVYFARSYDFLHGQTSVERGFNVY